MYQFACPQTSLPEQTCVLNSNSSFTPYHMFWHFAGTVSQPFQCSVFLPQVRPLCNQKHSSQHYVGHYRSHCYLHSETGAGNRYCHSGETCQQVLVGWCAMWHLSKMHFRKYLSRFWFTSQWNRWTQCVSLPHFKQKVNCISTHDQ